MIDENKVYHSFEEFEKDVFPNAYRKRKEEEKKPKQGRINIVSKDIRFFIIPFQTERRFFVSRDTTNQYIDD